MLELVPMADSVTVRKSAEIESLPVIDFGPFLSGKSNERASVASQIGAACEDVGFFYIKNHGVSASLIDRMFNEARAFFAQPLEKKMTIPATREHYRGYVASRSLGRGQYGKPDLFEGFKMQLDLGPDDPDVRAGKPLHQPNKWPADMPTFRATANEYWASMMKLSEELLRAFAMALGEAEDAFLPSFRKPLAQLSLLHYVPEPDDQVESRFGINPHRDTGAFTILTQDNTGGLEVGRRGSGWISAPSVDGAYLINIGDMIQRWTNDRFVSTPHRVINPARRDRISIPFFANADFDAVVTCLPSCVGPGNSAHYPALKVGDFMVERFSQNFD
jgi:isopenicillin N synthase-like dioxygenase